MKSAYLDPDAWDLRLDAAGNIATCDAPYRLAQDASTAIRAFSGECWYDQTIGVPYWQEILGQVPPVGLVRSKLTDAALTAPGVASARVYFTSLDRTISGQVHVTDAAGVTATAGF